MIHNSGIGVYIRHYLNYLLSKEAFVVTLLGRRKELTEAFGQFSNWKYVEADFPIYSIQEQIKLPLLIPSCDIFWSPHYNIPMLPIRANKRLVTVPDVFHIAHLETLTTAQKLYASTVTRAAVRLSDRIITISDFSAREITRLTGVLANKVVTIPLGLDRNLFKRVDDGLVRDRVRRKYQLPKQYILFVGNVKPNKNLQQLVEGFARLLTKLPDYYLLIVGKKDGFITGDKRLIDRIDTDPALAKKVSFSGYVDLVDLPVLYSMADVFAFPSIYEGFGFPPLEAMACGCPVVASNRSSIPEVCGTAAYYIDPVDAEDMEKGLWNVLTDETLRQRLIASGQAHVNQFDWGQSQQRFAAEIEKLG
ncbi:glycosyltransferase family 4 protein [Fibrella forsythiae]